jgi:hypothetical protein
MSRPLRFASVLSVACLAAAVCALEGYFAAPSLGGALALVAAAVALLAVASPHQGPLGRVTALAATAAAAALLAAGDFRLGASCLLACGLISLLPGRRWGTARLAQALGTSGMLLLVGEALVPLWVRLEVAQPALGFLAPPLALLARAGGVQAAVTDGALQLGTGWGTIGLSFDLFKLGGLFCFLLLLFDAAVTLRAAGPRRAGWRLLLAGGSLALYAPLRLVVLALCTPLLHTEEIVLSLAVVLSSFVPLLLLWAQALPGAEGERAPPAGAR